MMIYEDTEGASLLLWKKPNLSEMIALSLWDESDGCLQIIFSV